MNSRFPRPMKVVLDYNFHFHCALILKRLKKYFACRKLSGSDPLQNLTGSGSRNATKGDPDLVSTYPARRAPPWWWTCNRRRQSRFDSPPAPLWGCPGMRPIWAPDPGSAHKIPESIEFWSSIRARALKSMRAKSSDANPGSGAFLTPGSGIRKTSESRIPNPYFWELSDNFMDKKYCNCYQVP